MRKSISYLEEMGKTEVAAEYKSPVVTSRQQMKDQNQPGRSLDIFFVVDLLRDFVSDAVQDACVRSQQSGVTHRLLRIRAMVNVLR
jgi:hypothetical protein